MLQRSPRDQTGTLQQNLLMVRDWFVRRLRRGLNRWSWSWLQVLAPTPVTTAAGVATYALASDFRDMIDVYNQRTGDWLTPKPVEWIDSADPAKLQTSAPRVFSVFGGSTLVLYPVPDQAYTIAYRYNRNTPDPVLSSDILPLPNVDWAIEGTIGDGYRWLASVLGRAEWLAEARQYDAAFEDLLARAIDVDRPNVVLPHDISEQDQGGQWYSADDIRAHDMRFAL